MLTGKGVGKSKGSEIGEGRGKKIREDKTGKEAPNKRKFKEIITFGSTKT